MNIDFNCWIDLLLGVSFIALLIRIGWLDWKIRFIPNTLVGLLFLIGVIQMIQGHPLLPKLSAMLIGLVFIPAWLSGKIGAGDVKLLLACSFFLGWSGSIFMVILLLILIFITVSITLFRKQSLHVQIPLGPFICMSSVLSYSANIIFSIIRNQGGFL